MKSKMMCEMQFIILSRKTSFGIFQTDDSKQTRKRLHSITAIWEQCIFVFLFFFFFSCCSSDVKWKWGATNVSTLVCYNASYRKTILLNDSLDHRFSFIKNIVLVYRATTAVSKCKFSRRIHIFSHIISHFDLK